MEAAKMYDVRLIENFKHLRCSQMQKFEKTIYHQDPNNELALLYGQVIPNQRKTLIYASKKQPVYLQLHFCQLGLC